MLKQVLKFAQELNAPDVTISVFAQEDGKRMTKIRAVRKGREASVYITEETVRNSTAEVLLDWGALEMLNKELG